MSRLYPATHQNDVNTNFETYMSKLLKKKTEKPRALTKERPSRTSNPLQVNRLTNPRGIIVPYIKGDEKLLRGSDEELIHKEIINNKMAQVEVTVRTVTAKNRSRSNSVSEEKREPWAKLLHRRSNEVLSPNYDYGLGTIHYLSKELQQKLQTACPGDPTLQQIVSDIQHTLYRLNPTITSRSDNENIILPKDQCGDTNLNSKLRKENSEKSSKIDNCMQATNIGDSNKNVQKIYEYDPYNKPDNANNKIDSAVNIVQELESNINKIKAEKQEVERQLKAEKELVKNFKRDLEEQLVEKNNKSTAMINQLCEERDALQKQLQEIQNKENSNETEELNILIQKLKNDNKDSEYENISLKHELTIMKLEKDKMLFLLESRDKEIKALRNEIDAIQQLVSSQLFDLKTSSYSPTISRSK